MEQQLKIQVALCPGGKKMSCVDVLGLLVYS